MPQPTKRVVVVERIECPVPAADEVKPATAASAADAIVEEQDLAAIVAKLGTRLAAVWECIWRHNERAAQKEVKQ